MKKLITLISSLVFGFGFIACEQNITAPQSQPELETTTYSADVNEFDSGNGEQIVVQRTVTDGSGVILRIRDKNMNDVEFDIPGQELADGMVVRMIKRNKTSNRIMLEPVNAQIKRGFNITMWYTHSAMPTNVSEKDLSVFQRQNNNFFVRLDSRVNTRKREVYSTGYSGGEYVLGAVDGNGKFHIVEGEFGIRVEETINPKKGGVIRLPGGSQLEIPKGALDKRTTIGMIAERKTILGKGEEAKVFTFTPHGTVFNTPIKLTLNWKEYAGEEITMFYYNESTGKWELYYDGVWDEQNKTVTLEIPHFSRYAMAYGW